MTRSHAQPTLRAAVLVAACAVLVLPSAGCYRKVVNAKGLGADSAKLRSEYEHQPAHYTTQKKTRDTREVRPARERDTP